LTEKHILFLEENIFMAARIQFIRFAYLVSDGSSLK
jgi:hypothetical protein